MKRLVCLILLLVAAPLVADDSGRASPGASRKLAQAVKEKQGRINKPVTPAVDAKAEASVQEFVREHHPELADLLEQLKESRPKEYQKAIRDLSRVRERLHAMKNKDDRRYQLELDVWKAETRVQLIAARLHMGDKSELRDELRAALDEQMDLRLALLKHERDQTQQRIGKLDAQIKRFDSERSQQIEKQLEALLQPMGSKPVNEKPKNNKPAKKPS